MTPLPSLDLTKGSTLETIPFVNNSSSQGHVYTQINSTNYNAYSECCTDKNQIRMMKILAVNSVIVFGIMALGFYLLVENHFNWGLGLVWTGVIVGAATCAFSCSIWSSRDCCFQLNEP